jgi:hypothetical protein
MDEAIGLSNYISESFKTLGHFEVLEENIFISKMV